LEKVEPKPPLEKVEPKPPLEKVEAKSFALLFPKVDRLSQKY
jgi:hypothetical protein